MTRIAHLCSITFSASYSQLAVFLFWRNFSTLPYCSNLAQRKKKIKVIGFFTDMSQNLLWQLKKRSHRLNWMAMQRQDRKYISPSDFLIYFFLIMSPIHLQQPCFHRVMCPRHLKNPIQLPLVPRWKTIMIPLLLDINHRSFQGTTGVWQLVRSTGAGELWPTTNRASQRV